MCPQEEGPGLTFGPVFVQPLARGLGLLGQCNENTLG